MGVEEAIAMEWSRVTEGTVSSVFVLAPTRGETKHHQSKAGKCMAHIRDSGHVRVAVSDEKLDRPRWT